MMLRKCYTLLSGILFLNHFTAADYVKTNASPNASHFSYFSFVKFNNHKQLRKAK